MEIDSGIGTSGMEDSRSRIARLEERFLDMEARILDLEPRILDLEADHAYHQRSLEDYDDEFYRLEQRMVRLEEMLSRMTSAMKDLAEAKQGPLPSQERPPHY